MPHTSTVVRENEQIPSKPKKRLVNKKKWNSVVRKESRNSGKSYKSTSNKIVPSKQFANRLCNCKRLCNNMIEEEDRRQCFESFWKLADFSRQNVYIKGLVKSSAVNRKRTRDGSRSAKSTSFQYFLLVRGVSVQVCKTFFLDTFQISVGRLYRCLIKDDVALVMDSRGRNPKKRVDDSKVIEHINSFPAYRSHYTRKDNPKKKYLHPDLTTAKMYRLKGKILLPYLYDKI